jgi:membrane complex biogenesis BtpA family protein
VSLLEEIFGVSKPIIGMIHLRSLPGSLGSIHFEDVLEYALKDAENLIQGEVDGLLIENFMDSPFYPRRVPPHIISYMTIIAWEVKKRYNKPIGINVLRNDAMAALAIASSINADFIRVNVHIGCVATDQGIIQGEAYKTLRYRLLLGSDVKIFADVASKHGKLIYEPPLPQLARDTYYRGKADALIITGPETGSEVKIEELEIVKRAVPEAPILVGSGVNTENIHKILNYADGAIVGTYFKINGIVWNSVDLERVREFMQKVRKLR